MTSQIVSRNVFCENCDVFLNTLWEREKLASSLGVPYEVKLASGGAEESEALILEAEIVELVLMK